MGFVGDKFVVTDVDANDVLSVSAKRDDHLKRLLPLEMLKKVESTGCMRDASTLESTFGLEASSSSSHVGTGASLA